MKITQQHTNIFRKDINHMSIIPRKSHDIKTKPEFYSCVAQKYGLHQGIHIFYLYQNYFSVFLE